MALPGNLWRLDLHDRRASPADCLRRVRAAEVTLPVDTRPVADVGGEERGLVLVVEDFDREVSKARPIERACTRDDLVEAARWLRQADRLNVALAGDVHCV